MLVASTSGGPKVRVRGPIELPEQLVLRGGPQHPPLIRCDDQAVSSSVLMVRPAQCQALLGDMAGVGLHKFPSDRPLRVQERPVAMPGRLDAHLRHRVEP